MSNEEKIMEEARQALERWGVGYLEIKTPEDAQAVLDAAPDIDAKIARAKELTERADRATQAALAGIEGLGVDGDRMRENWILNVLDAFDRSEGQLTQAETEDIIRAAFMVDDSLGRFVENTLTFVNSDYYRRILANIREMEQFLQDNVNLYRFDDGVELRAQDPEAVEILGELEGYLAQEIEPGKNAFGILRDGTNKAGVIIDGDAGRLVRGAIERQAIKAAAVEADPREIKKAVAAAEDVGALPAFASVFNSLPVINMFRSVAPLSGKRLMDDSVTDRHQSIEIKSQKGGGYAFLIKNKSKDYEIEIGVDDVSANTVKQYDKKNGETKGVIYNSALDKEFLVTLLFIFQKMAQQNAAPKIGFTLRELVETGLYTDVSNAKRGMKMFFRKTKLLHVRGQYKNGKRIIAEKEGVLFSSIEFRGGYVTLNLNSDYNFDFLASQFTIFPKAFYRMSTNGVLLAFYFLSIARMNAPRIKDKGKFTVSFDACRRSIGLPAVEEVRHRRYKQQIKDPLLSAHEEIEEAVRKMPEAGAEDFTITPHGSEAGPIEEWLQGYFEIGIKGEFAKMFVDLAQKAESDRRKWERAKLKAEADAIARAEKAERLASEKATTQKAKKRNS